MEVNTMEEKTQVKRMMNREVNDAEYWAKISHEFRLFETKSTALLMALRCAATAQVYAEMYAVALLREAV